MTGAHVMLLHPAAYCPTCGEAMLYLERMTPPNFTARAWCGVCNYTVALTAQTWQGVRADAV
jgi:hypothetical protein